jgi:hypothetical protein
MFGTLQRSAAAIALFPEPANRWLDERLWIALFLIGVLCGAQAAGSCSAFFICVRALGPGKKDY